MIGNFTEEHGYFFQHEDETKFVQCGLSDGQCYVESCPPDTIWIDDIKACDYPPTRMKLAQKINKYKKKNKAQK